MTLKEFKTVLASFPDESEVIFTYDGGIEAEGVEQVYMPLLNGGELVNEEKTIIALRT